MVSWVHHEGRSQGRRAYQEDDYGVLELPEALQAGELLLVLADGMGGKQAGDVASAVVVRSFMDSYSAAADSFIPSRLLHALGQANKALATRIATDPQGLTGMGCTLLAAVLVQYSLYWISVGDSPLWLWREGRLIRLNKDHSYRYILARQVAAGKISLQEAAHHPDRNALISAVTGSAIELLDLPREAYHLRAGDQLLLASDGLLTLSGAEIARLMGDDPTKEPVSQRLLKAVDALQYPYQDNVTVMVVQAPRKRWQTLIREHWLLGLMLAIIVVLGLGWLWWQQDRNLSQPDSVQDPPLPVSVSKMTIQGSARMMSGLEVSP